MIQVKIKTGRTKYPTCIVAVDHTTWRGAPCIEIISSWDIHPRGEDDRPDILDESYCKIAETIFGEGVKFELDERDPREMWIWKR